MKRLLLTGGSGFIGKNIFEQLSPKFSIFAPTHAELDIVDTAHVIAYIQKNKITTIIHSATAVGVNYFEPTIRMFRSIVEASLYVDHVYYFGSGAEYGKHRDIQKMKEKEVGDVIPLDPNGLSKYINTKLARTRNNITILRLFGVFGKYEDYTSKFISNCIVKHICGLPIVINQDARFDYVYIDDVCRIVEKILNKNMKYLDYTITPDTSILLHEIADIVNQIGKKSVSISVLHSGLNKEYTGDNTRFKKEFPSFRFCSYKKSIELLYAYYMKQKKYLDKEKIMQDGYLKHIQNKQTV